jgi:SAM-dependent methyltransferase
VPYAVVIARQRSGTTAFASLLREALDLKTHGEILDPDGKSPAINDSDGVPSWPLAEAFLQQLHADKAFHLIDIKINSLNSVGKPFRSPSLRPPLFDLFQRHRARIIRLHRHPAAQWTSGLIAVQSGVWHQRDTGKAASGKVHVDPLALEQFVDSCAREEAVLSGWMQGLSVIELQYDEVFATDDYSLTLAKLADFIGAPVRPGWTSARPKLHKIANPSLVENVRNAAEIRHLLPLEPDRNAKRVTTATAPLRLDDLPEPLRTRAEERLADLRLLTDCGVISQSHITGKVVLDWECGDGAFAAAFGISGAQLIIASDKWLDIARVPAALRDRPDYRLRRAGIAAFESQIHGAIDLVFANTVTEHMPDLPSDFAAVYRVLRPGGHFVINHDNYYQPVGSHDHGFLYYGAGDVVRQGPDCWNSDLRCAASQAHRDDIAQRLPWTWDRRNETHRDPLMCKACHYYKRSQPWAHLLYQDEFDTLFPQDSFSTGRKNSSLNKVTMFQLRQFLIEAGFEVEKEHRATIGNDPPAALLQGTTGFTAADLKTSMYRVRARRKA